MIDNLHLLTRLASLRIMREQKKCGKSLSATAIQKLILEEFLLNEKKQKQQILNAYRKWVREG